MTAQQVKPWKMAIEHWLERIEAGNHLAAFRDRWMRLHEMSSADLELTPIDRGVNNESLILGLKVSSLGTALGHFSFAARDAACDDASRTVIFCAPTFTQNIDEGLKHAILSCLFKLAPEGSELEVLIEDVVEAPTSTLSAAGLYTSAGWGLNPANTKLLSEAPRQWVFRFSKN